MTTFIESGFAAVVALVFGLIADKIDLHTAMLWTIPFPWIICAILFSGFYLTYPKDLEKNQKLMESRAKANLASRSSENKKETAERQFLF